MKLERRTLWAWRVSMPLAFLLTGAGGLGLAPLVWLAGLGAAPFRALGPHLRRPSLALILTLAALGWYCLSFAWSPYEKPEELFKLAFATPVFALLPFAVSRMGEETRAAARPWAVFGALAALGYLFMEALTQGHLNMSYKLAVEGYEGTLDGLMPFINRTLSRAATPAIMFGGAAAVMLWCVGRTGARLLAVACAILLVVAAGAFNMHANMVGLAAGSAAAALAALRPRATLQAIIWGTALLILAGPVLMAAVLSVIPQDMRDSVPLSWEWRLEIWAYANALIAERPITGHGLDATRVLNDTTELRGMTIELLPLHVHNAPLHLWLEGGLVGAGLVAAALGALGAWIGRVRLSRPAWISLAFVVGVWLVNVLVGYGLWQEWHHAALALGVGFSLLQPGRKIA